jgi:hypothetical protein
VVMLRKGADHTTIAMHDQPARKPLSSSVIRVTHDALFRVADRRKYRLTAVKGGVKQLELGVCRVLKLVEKYDWKSTVERLPDNRVLAQQPFRKAIDHRER